MCAGLPMSSRSQGSSVPGRCRWLTEKPVNPALGRAPRPVAPSSRISPPAPVAAPGEGRDRRRVVVRLHLHQHMRRLAPRAVGRRVGEALRQPALHRAALHHRGVVAVGHDAVLRRQLLGVADHAEHAQRLALAVDGEVGVEDLVAAMFAVGLREHHQLDIAGVALQTGEGLDQVVDLVVAQRQAELGVGLHQRRAAGAQHVDMGQRLGVTRIEQVAGGIAAEGHALGHAVVQQGSAAAMRSSRLSGLARRRASGILELSGGTRSPARRGAVPGRSCARCRWPCWPRATACPGAASRRTSSPSDAA